MPSEMVKRIADEAKAQAACLNDWEAEGVARAAIEAMRKPTTMMLVNSGTMEGYEGHRELADQNHIEWWQAMIDAALEIKR